VADADANQPKIKTATIERATVAVPPSQVGDTHAKLTAEGWTIVKMDPQADQIVITAEREAPPMPATKSKSVKTPPSMTMGEKLREARINAGLTARQVAENAGLAPPFISNVENGRREPEMQTIWVMCVGIGCDPYGFDDRLRPLDADGIAAYRAKLQTAAIERAKQAKKAKKKES